MHRLGILFFILCCGLSIFALPAQAGFKDAINFEDNQFLPVGSLEVKHRYQRFSQTEPRAHERSEFSYQMTYAAVQNFEMGASSPVVFFKDRDEEGLGDISIFQRYKFMEQQANIPAISAGLELILPTGDRDLSPAGSNNLDARLYSIVSQEMALGWTWMAQVGYRFFGDSGAEDRFEYNVGVNYAWGPRFKPVLEINGHTGGVPDQDEVYASPGLIVQLRQGVTASVSVPLGVTSHSATHKTNVQIAVEF